MLQVLVGGCRICDIISQLYTLTQRYIADSQGRNKSITLFSCFCCLFISFFLFLNFDSLRKLSLKTIVVVSQYNIEKMYSAVRVNDNHTVKPLL